MTRLRYAMVCASNQNRSMEAHALLMKQGMDVSSYGTGAHVKLPGPSIREPNVYSFGTPYQLIFEDLKRKDPHLYKRNGLLQMLKRNLSVKEAPQRWQDNAADGAFDVVFTFEERVFDIVIEDLHNREQKLMKTALVINLDVKDNHEEAAVGAKHAFEFCQKVSAVIDQRSFCGWGLQGPVFNRNWQTHKYTINDVKRLLNASQFEVAKLLRTSAILSETAELYLKGFFTRAHFGLNSHVSFVKSLYVIFLFIWPLPLFLSKPAFISVKIHVNACVGVFCRFYGESKIC